MGALHLCATLFSILCAVLENNGSQRPVLLVSVEGFCTHGNVDKVPHNITHAEDPIIDLDTRPDPEKGTCHTGQALYKGVAGLFVVQFFTARTPSTTNSFWTS